MPADINLLPHRACVSRPVHLGERRFIGLQCPDAPPRTPTGKPDQCRLCGHLNTRHRVRYRMRWAAREDQIANLRAHAQCPRCHHRIRKEPLIELTKLRGDKGAVERYTLARFAALLRTSEWLDMEVEYKSAP